METLPIGQQQYELTTQQSKLATYLSVAFERTGTEPKDISLMLKDLTAEFKFLNDDDFKKAIRNGGLGKYGKTYKLTTQEVCVWIREYLKEKNKNRCI